jgi:hypothetical protein
MVVRMSIIMSTIMSMNTLISIKKVVTGIMGITTIITGP